MFETVGKLSVEIVHEIISSLRGIFVKVIKEAICKVRILGHHIVEVLHPLLAHSVLVCNIILHVLALIFDLLNDLLFVGNPCLLFFYEAVLDGFDLSSNRIEMVIVVLNSVDSFLVNSLFALVHARVVACPMFSKDVGFFVHLTFEIVSQVLQLLLEALLKLVYDVVDVIHSIDCLLSVFSNFFISIVELLFHLTLIFDTSVLEHLKTSAHVFHLTLELGQVFILPFCFFNH